MGATSIRDKEMAADLRKRGIYHGKRITSGPPAHNYPRVSDPAGSACYRRYLETIRPRRVHANADS